MNKATTKRKSPKAPEAHQKHKAAPTRASGLYLPLQWINRYSFVISLLLLVLTAPGVNAQGLNLEWARSLPGKGYDFGNGVVLDTMGNVYVTGTFNDTLDCDPGPGTAYLISAKISNNDPSQTNIFIAKYDPNGNYIWAKSIRGQPGFKSYLAIDATGSLIVAGLFIDSTDFDPGPNLAILHPAGQQEVFIAKYDGNGNFIWVKNMAVGAWPSAVDVDPMGNIAISGTFDDSADFDPGTGTAWLVAAQQTEIYVARYDNDGNYLWAHRMGGMSNQYDLGAGVASGSDGSVVATGAFGGVATFSSTTFTMTAAGGGRDAYVMKHDSAGNFQWAIPIGGPAGDHYGLDVAIDKDDNVYAAGYFEGTVDFDPGPGTYLLTANTFYDGYLAKYDPDGNFIWALNVGGGYLNFFTGVSTDGIGNVYICGFFSGTADFDPGPNTANLTTLSSDFDACVAKYNVANGAYLWAGALQTTGSTGTSSANMLAVDAAGKAYVTGLYFDANDFDPGPGTDPHISTNGSADAFLVKLACGDTASTHVSVVSCDSIYTSNGETYSASGTYIQHLPNATHCDSMIVLHLTMQQMAAPVITVNGFLLGTTMNYITYQWIKNGSPIPGANNSTYNVIENGDYQVTVTNAQGCSTTSAIYKVTNATAVIEPGGIGRYTYIYPNPATDKIMISCPVEVNAELLSVDGRHLLYNKKAKAISIKEFSAGIYLLRLTDKQGRVIKYEKITKQPGL